jgi:hypothetical protein
VKGRVESKYLLMIVIGALALLVIMTITSGLVESAAENAISDAFN